MKRAKKRNLFLYGKLEINQLLLISFYSLSIYPYFFSFVLCHFYCFISDRLLFHFDLPERCCITQIQTKHGQDYATIIAWASGLMVRHQVFNDIWNLDQTQPTCDQCLYDILVLGLYSFPIRNLPFSAFCHYTVEKT